MRCGAGRVGRTRGSGARRGAGGWGGSARGTRDGVGGWRGSGSRPPAARGTSSGMRGKSRRTLGGDSPPPQRQPPTAMPDGSRDPDRTRQSYPDVPRAFAPSYPLDDLLAEDTVGTDHQRQDHQHVRREVLGAAADPGVDVAGRHVLHDPDDEAPDDRARDRIQPAQDHDREDLEADQREVDVHAERSEEHTSELQSLAYLVCRLLLEKKKKTRDHD